MRSTANGLSCLEPLEGRMLLAGSPLGVAERATSLGLELWINGSSGSDQILISRSGDMWTINNGDWRTVRTGRYAALRIDGGAGDDRIEVDGSVTTPAALYGGAGSDTLIGGAGADRLYGGAGRDLLKGRGGDDVLVSIGGGDRDQLVGGAGSDSFWTDAAVGESVRDASAGELARGNVHRVASFFNYRYSTGGGFSTAQIGAELLGENLVDPVTTSTNITYRNFADRPLFSTGGPLADDVSQGYVGDCYFLATLSAVAKTNPNLIRQSVADLGDGTYAVRFVQDVGSGPRDVYVRVDADLPTWSWGALAYADLGAQGATWVAIMEKAWAFFRYDEGSYESISGGWMSEVFTALGRNSEWLWSAQSTDALVSWIEGELAQGKAVTIATQWNQTCSLMIGGHAYSVDRVSRDGQGNVSVVVRNPWGVDGGTLSGANDGYVTLSAAQLASCFMAGTSAAV